MEMAPIEDEKVDPKDVDALVEAQQKRMAEKEAAKAEDAMAERIAQVKAAEAASDVPEASDPGAPEKLKGLALVLMTKRDGLEQQLANLDPRKTWVIRHDQTGQYIRKADNNVTPVALNLADFYMQEAPPEMPGQGFSPVSLRLAVTMAIEDIDRLLFLMTKQLEEIIAR